MFSLVSSKFLAMRNITLYSVTVATTRPSILVLWTLKDHRYFFCAFKRKRKLLFPQQTELQHVLLSTFSSINQQYLKMSYASYIHLCKDYGRIFKSLMVKIIAQLQIYISENSEKLSFLQKKWWLNTKCVLKIPNTPQFIQQICPVSQNIWDMLEKNCYLASAVQIPATHIKQKQNKQTYYAG